uniref:Eukaryotic translation initiation factor 4 gamma 3 n=1 Tax=Sinocyclocheilus grahami TaxID=75366 RepID=A0A672T546_SINGR
RKIFSNFTLPRIPRAALSLEERMFPAHSGVTAVYSVSRHPGPPYPGHDLGKTHPNLAGTPPGHATSPALSQVSVPAAPSYRFLKGWETGGGPPYNPAQNAGSAPLVYSPQTQPMNIQPQTRPFVTGPRPTHHQFLHRTQLQPARPALPTNSPSIRPGSQTPTATVYPSNQPIMMTMTHMPFPTQTHQYYIPQYRHSAPYVGPPQQYAIQPPGSGTFYPGPGPGEYPAPYGKYRPLYSAHFSVSMLASHPAGLYKLQIRIRDPNQGGKDITEEIMFGSRNPTPPTGHLVSTLTPPAGRPSSTPTPPTGHLSSTPTPPQVFPFINVLTLSLLLTFIDDRPKMESGPIKPVSPGPRPSDSTLEKGNAPSLPLLASSSPELASDVPSYPSSGCIKPTAAEELEVISPSTTKAQAHLVNSGGDSIPETSLRLSASHSTSLKVVNGLAESQTPLSSYEEPEVQEALKISLSREVQLPTQGTSSTEESSQEVPVALEELQTKHLPSLAVLVPLIPTVQASSSTSCTTTVLGPPPGLAPLVQPVVLEVPEQNKSSDNVQIKVQDASESQTQNNSRKFIPSGICSSHDLCYKSGKIKSLVQSNGKRQYDRDFLLGFQFMPACVQKPEGLPQISDVVLDKVVFVVGISYVVRRVGVNSNSAKAIDEPSFSVAYANMCRCLTTLKVPTADKPNTTVNFRKLLLNRCQKEFERDKVDDVVLERKQKELDSATSPTERERLQEELEEAKDKARRRSTGNIKFIGELFKLKMLTEPIMHDCVVKLLKNHDDESLECLCRLLTTIGKDLDFEKAKPRMDQYFNQMEKIVKERKTSSRIRFMLQDVIDLRLHNWVSRRADQGPKTIEQIHKEAKLEEQEEQRKVHQQLLSKDIKRRPDQRSQREETWNTVPTTKNSRTIDPTKIPKISKPQIDEKIQLGPRAQINWIKGSSGGAKASDSELTRSCSSTLNRYSALQSSASQPSPPPAQTSDSDSRRPLGSRGSTGRERSEKSVSLGPSRPGPFSRGSSAKELTDNVAPQETQREGPDSHHTPRKVSISEEKCEIENNRATETLKSETLQVAGVSEKPILSEEEVERKSKSIIDEFLHINDYKEAVQCVMEMDQPSLLFVFVRMGLECTLERSQKAREHMALLYYQLIQKGIIPHSQLYKGFSEMLEQADDMAIDVPFIWLYLAELLSPLLREGGISMRELFSELSKPLLPVGRAAILFSEILHLLCKQMSHRKVGDLWRESGLNWADFLPEGEHLPTFISQQKLEFTVSDVSPVSPATAKPSLSPEELFKELEHLLLEDMASDEQIFDWVEANLDESQMSSSPFLRALMTAVCKAAVKDESTSCRVDTAIIQRRLPILHKYLNSDTERQLQALYALQSLIVALDQPPNLLRMFFDCLYDEDVISEDAFYQWETSEMQTLMQVGK